VGDIVTLLMNLGAYIRSNQLPQVGSWSYFILAILVAIEGPVATLLGAAAASTGLMRPGLVFIAAAAGNLTADSLWYTLGYVGRIEWLLRVGQKLGVRREYLERLQAGMHRHATRILFIAKLTVSLVIPSLIAAGLVRAPWKRWFPAIFAGEMIWTGSLVLIGFYTTEAIKRIEQGVGYVILVSTLVFLFFLLWLVHRILTRKYNTEVEISKDIK
jgi:membrane protein DedA with SNARE-associated domain